MDMFFSIMGGVGITILVLFIISYCYWLYRLTDQLVTRTRLVDMRLKKILEELREMKGWNE